MAEKEKERTAERTSSLDGALELAGSGRTKEIGGDGLRVVHVFSALGGLDQEWLGECARHPSLACPCTLA